MSEPDDASWVHDGDTFCLIDHIRRYLEFHDALAAELLHDGVITRELYDEGRETNTPLRKWMKFQEWARRSVEGRDAEG
jgi:hypothetical protein